MRHFNARFAGLLLSLIACARQPDTARTTPTHPAASKALAPGVFRLVQLESSADGTTRYLATAPEGAMACQFEIAIGDTRPPAGSIFTLSSVSLSRRQRSDCTPFLKALGPMLGFKGPLPAPPPVSALKASVAILGINQSRSSRDPEVAGSFSSQPPGHWTATKLFLADGEGEVYLNLNPKEGFGEFSLKDEDYAETVVTELARLLLPPRGAA